MAKDTAQADDLTLDDDQIPADEPEIIVEAADEPKEAAKTEPKPVIEAAEGIEALKSQLAAEKAAREADRAARQAAEQAFVRSQTEVQDTNVQLVTNAIAQMRQATDGLKAQYAEALAQGDYSGAADVQAEMSEVAAKRLTLENGLEQLKNQPKPQAPRQNDPVELMAAGIAQSGAPRSADWLRAHPQYATDERLTRRMIAAANLAETDGYRIDSDEYFDAVERTLGLRQAPADTDSALSEASAPVQRRQSPPAAPVSRGANGGGSNPTRVTLTAAEREAAADMQMSEKEYAQNKLALQREGKLN